jgi:hypothetical protein
MGGIGRKGTEGAQTVGRAMAAQVTEAQLPTSEATREQCDRDEAEQMAEACSSKALMGPND